MKKKLKAKKIKQRVKAKKSVAAAATALILSGSPIVTLSAFAEEKAAERTAPTIAKEAKENLTSPSEELIPEAVIEAPESSTQEVEQPAQTTQKEAPTDVSQDHSANEKPSSEKVPQEGSNELPASLRTARYSQLADGRISVDVSTFEQLKEAFNSTVIGQVNLTNDIVFTSNIRNPKNNNLVIQGNNHTLYLSNYQIYNAVQGHYLKMINLTTLEGYAGADAVILYVNSTVELENVTHRGAEFVDAKNIHLRGKIDVTLTRYVDASTNVFLVWYSQNGQFIVEENAVVNIRTAVTSSMHAVIAPLNCNTFKLSKNSVLNIEQSSPTHTGAISYIKNGMNMIIEEGAKLNINSPTARGISGPLGSINIVKGGELNVQTNKDYAIFASAANARINLFGGKFDIQSTATNGSPLYMGANGAVNLEKQNVRAWVKNFQTAANPQYSWDNVTGVVSMSGQKTQSANTNNFQFNSQFKTEQFSRIASDGHVTQEIAKTTINELKDTATTVSGTAEPNAKIELKNGDKVIASGTVGSDGKYSLTIPKQAAGTKVTAVASIDGQSSEAETTVIRGALAETTISDIDTTITSVSGKAEPNAKIEIKVGNKVIASGTVGSDGFYSLTIPKQTAGTVVKAVASADGLTSEAETTVVRGELEVTTIPAITTETTRVTGTAEPNAKIELKNGDKVIASGTVGSDGKYSLTIDPQAEGSTIIAIVTKNGLKSQASTVVIREALAETTISNIDTTTTSVSGKAEPNAKIEIKVGNKVIAEGKVGSDGFYSLTIPKQPVGTVVKAVATLGGKSSEAETTVTRGELIQTTISDITSKTTTVTGTAEPNAKIELKNGDKVIASGTVGSDGKYSLTIDPQPGNSVIVAVVTKDGKESQASTVVEGETEGTVSPTEYTINGGDNYVRGTYTGDVDYLKLEVNGKEYAKSTVTSSPFKYYAVDKIKKGTDKVYVVAYDKDGKELDRKQVTIKDATTKGTVTPNAYTIQGDNYIRGTYTGDVDYLKLEVNGKEYAKSTVTSSPFKYYAADKVKKATDKVYIVAYDKDGKELDRKQVTVNAPEMNISLKADTYAVGGTDNYVHGSFSGTGSEKIDHVRLEVNDVLYARSTKFDNGKFDYYAVDKIKSTTDKVYVVAYDKDGNQLARTQVALKNGTTQGTITPNKFLLGGTDNYVRGTYTGDVDSIKLEVNGKTLVKSTVKSSPFQYYAVDKITNVKDSVYIIAYDVNGRQLDRQKVTVEEAVKTQITKVDTYTLGASNYVTGTYEGTAKKVGITVNGTSYSPVNINAAGQLSYWSKNIITSSSDDVKVAIYDANGSKIDEKPVTVIQQAGKITKVDPFKVGFDSRITGTFSGAVARVELNVNGVPQSRVPVSNGAFSYYAKNLVTSADDVVKLVAYDSSNNKLDEKEVPIIAASGTLSVDSTTYSLKNSDGRIYGTVTGNISKVKIKIGTTEYSAVNVTNGTFGYYVKNLPLKVGDTITVIGMDNNLTELDTQMVAVID